MMFVVLCLCFIDVVYAQGRRCQYNRFTDTEDIHDTCLAIGHFADNSVCRGKRTVYRQGYRLPSPY